MSNLSSLFSMGGGGGGGGTFENADALKYSAPKEPKRKVSIKIEANDVKASSAAPAASPAQKPAAPAQATAVSAQQSKPLGPSKVMASAAVRLYKINQSTRAYEPVENGAMLGCAILGTGLNFQILVYNAQKVPQAAVSLSSAFDYTVRDFYVSFADSSGNFWSLLFDNFDSMTNVLKVIAAIVFHMNTHNETAMESLRRLLPRNADVAADETVLAAGMTAGIYIDVFEIGEQADYPGDMVQSPIKHVGPPGDVIKVKVGSSDIIAGLGDALVGLTKGDRCMVGVSPRLFYQPTSNEWVSMAERKYPTNWIILQVEIVKIKSSETKEKKKKAKDEDAVAIIPAIAAQPAAPVDSTPDIKARMAKMSAAGGAGHQLGDILIGRKSITSVEAETVAVVAEAVAYSPPPTPTQPVAQVQPVIAQPSPQPQVQLQVQPKQQQIAPVAQVAATATPVNAYRPQDSILAQKEAMLQQSQETINQQMASSGLSPAYAVAVAAESSSMMMGDTSMRERGVVMMLENSQQTQQQYFTQFQQSMMIIQQSMMQMNSKLDQVSMSVNNTFTVVQQQASAVTSANGGNNGMGGGMGGMGGMGMNNMGGMMGMNNMGGMGGMGMGMNNMGMGGMNPMAMGMGGMNPMMMQQMGYGNGNNMNNGSYYGASNALTTTSSSSPMRGKVEELVSTAQFVMQQYDQLKRENEELQQRGQSQQEVQMLQEQIRQLKSTVSDLENQRSQWQKEKDQMNGTIDNLRSERTRLENDLVTAKKATDLESPAIQMHVQSKLSEQQTSFTNKIRDLETQLEQSRQSASRVSILEGQLSSLEMTLSNVRTQAEKDVAEARAAAAATSTANATITSTAVDTANNEERISQLEADLVGLRGQLAAAQEATTATQLLLAEATKKNESAPAKDDAKIAELEQKIQELEANVAGKITDEDFKLCIQDIYVQAGASFITPEELESVEDDAKRETMAQVTKLNLKRLKEVLRQLTISRMG